MTTGVSIYLVSACTTGEEFVAAFRRYADRGSLFVPIAEPIPAGRRGRFALTLAGGGVLLEGEAEVISSSKIASVLHGRVGMTIRFGELDDASKTVLIELEKARLVAKPPAPSVSPRQVELPDGPRPKPPATSVRIDASVALAECTALGDQEALEKTTAAPPKAGPKFVMPSVLPVGAPRTVTGAQPGSAAIPRPNTPSGAQPIVERPKTPSVPPSMPALSPLPKMPSGPVKAAPPSPIEKPAGPFSATMPAVQLEPKPKPKLALDVALANASKEIAAAKTETIDVPRTPSAIIADVDDDSTTGMHDVPLPSTPAAAQPPRAAEIAVEVDEDSATGTHDVPLAPVMDLDEVMDGPRTEAMEAVSAGDQPYPAAPLTPTEMAAVPPPPSAADTKKKTPEWMLMTVRSSSPPPPTPAPPVVAVQQPIKMLEPDLDEPTDLTTMPIIPEDSGRKTSLGVGSLEREPASLQVRRPPTVEGDDVPVEIVDALPPELDSRPTAIDDADTSVTEQPPEAAVAMPAAVRAVSAKPPTVEEPTPSGDWTITPGVDKPTIEPRKPTPSEELTPIAQAPEVTPKAPAGPATGNWTIQLDPSAADGWSEPSKIDAVALPDPAKPKKKRTKPTPETPPELRPVARSIMMEALAPAPPQAVTASEEPKVQIDPTLMEAPIVDPNYGAPPPVTLSALMPAVQPPISAQQAAVIPQEIPVMPPMPVMPMAPPIQPQQIEHMRLATPVPGTMAPMLPIDRPTPSPIGIDPRVTPLPSGLVAQFPPPPGQVVSPTNLVSIPTPPPGRLVTDGGVGFFRDSGEITNLSGSGSFPVGDSTSLVDARRRRRLIVIAISAGVVVALGVVLVIMFAGGSDKKTEEASVPDAAVVAPPDAETRVAVTPDAAADVVKDAGAVAPPPKKECTVDVTTVPPGAEVLVQGSVDVLGVSPVKIPLPCGLEARLLVRKQRFGNVLRTATPTEEGEKIRITLAKLLFSVKVSSAPAGAAVSVGGKQVAVTPTTMKLPAFEQSTVTFTKDGFTVETQKITPKQNNQTVHAVLKKKPRR